MNFQKYRRAIVTWSLVNWGGLWLLPLMPILPVQPAVAASRKNQGAHKKKSASDRRISQAVPTKKLSHQQYRWRHQYHAHDHNYDYDYDSNYNQEQEHEDLQRVHYHSCHDRDERDSGQLDDCNHQSQRGASNFSPQAASLFAQSISPEATHVLPGNYSYPAFLEVAGFAQLGGNKRSVEGGSVPSTALLYDLFLPYNRPDGALFFLNPRIFDRSGHSLEGNLHLGYRRPWWDEKAMLGGFVALDRRRVEHGCYFNQATLGIEFGYLDWWVGGNYYQPFGQKSCVLDRGVHLQQINNAGQTGNRTHYEDGLALVKRQQIYTARSGVDAQFGYALRSGWHGYLGGYYFDGNIKGGNISVEHERTVDMWGLPSRLTYIIGGRYDNYRGAALTLGVKLRADVRHDGSYMPDDRLLAMRRMGGAVRRDPDVIVTQNHSAQQSLFPLTAIRRLPPPVSALDEKDRPLPNKQGYMKRDHDWYREHFATLQQQDFANWSRKERSRYRAWLLNQLCLAADTSDEQVKRSWRDFVFKYHPDRQPIRHRRQAEKVFVQRQPYYDEFLRLARWQQQQQRQVWQQQRMQQQQRIRQQRQDHAGGGCQQSAPPSLPSSSQVMLPSPYRQMLTKRAIATVQLAPDLGKRSAVNAQNVSSSLPPLPSPLFAPPTSLLSTTLLNRSLSMQSRQSSLNSSRPNLLLESAWLPPVAPTPPSRILNTSSSLRPNTTISSHILSKPAYRWQTFKAQEADWSARIAALVARDPVQYLDAALYGLAVQDLSVAQLMPLATLAFNHPQSQAYQKFCAAELLLKAQQVVPLDWMDQLAKMLTHAPNVILQRQVLELLDLWFSERQLVEDNYHFLSLLRHQTRWVDLLLDSWLKLAPGLYVYAKQMLAKASLTHAQLARLTFLEQLSASLRAMEAREAPELSEQRVNGLKMANGSSVPNIINDHDATNETDAANESNAAHKSLPINEVHAINAPNTSADGAHLQQLMTRLEQLIADAGTRWPPVLAQLLVDRCKRLTQTASGGHDALPNCWHPQQLLRLFGQHETYANYEDGMQLLAILDLLLQHAEQLAPLAVNAWGRSVEEILAQADLAEVVSDLAEMLRLKNACAPKELDQLMREVLLNNPDLPELQGYLAQFASDYQRSLRMRENWLTAHYLPVWCRDQQDLVARQVSPKPGELIIWGKMAEMEDPVASALPDRTEQSLALRHLQLATESGLIELNWMPNNRTQLKLYDWRQSDGWQLVDDDRRSVTQVTQLDFLVNQTNWAAWQDGYQSQIADAFYPLAHQLSILPNLHGVCKPLAAWRQATLWTEAELEAILSLTPDEREVIRTLSQQDSDFVRWYRSYYRPNQRQPLLIDGGELLAVIAQALYNVKGFYPRACQLLAAYLTRYFPRGALLEVATGEGKAAIIAMFTAMHMLDGKMVDISTSSSELASRDAREYADFYQQFAWLVGDNTKQQRTVDGAKQAYLADLVYGDINNFIGDELYQRVYGTAKASRGLADLHVVDEVDNLLIDNLNMMVMLGSVTPGFEQLNPLYATLYGTFQEYTSLIEQRMARGAQPAGCYLKRQLAASEQSAPQPSLSSASSGKEMERENDSSDREHAKTNVTTSSWASRAFSRIIGRLNQTTSAKSVNQSSSPSQEKGTANDDADLSLFLADNCAEFLLKIMPRYLNETLLRIGQERGESLVLLPDELQSFVRKERFNLANNLLLSFSYRKDVHYIIREHDRTGQGQSFRQALPVDGATGVTMPMLQWSSGLHAFIELREQLAPKTEHIAAIFQPFVDYFRSYQALYGFSGTLGSSVHHRILHELYGVTVLRMPTFKASGRHHYPPIFAQDQQAWLSKIVQSIHQYLIGAKRAVLVICETIEEARRLQTELLAPSIHPWPALPARKIRMYIYGGDQRTKRDAERAMQPGELMIATNLAGRGADIKLTTEAVAAGGLHVIKTTWSDSLRVEQQAFGRAGRQGLPGSAQLIIDISAVSDGGACCKRQDWRADGTISDADCERSLLTARDRHERQVVRNKVAKEVKRQELQANLFDQFLRFRSQILYGGEFDLQLTSQAPNLMAETSNSSSAALNLSANMAYCWLSRAGRVQLGTQRKGDWQSIDLEDYLAAVVGGVSDGLRRELRRLRPQFERLSYRMQSALWFAVQHYWEPHHARYQAARQRMQRDFVQHPQQRINYWHYQPAYLHSDKQIDHYLLWLLCTPYRQLMEGKLIDLRASDEGGNRTFVSHASSAASGASINLSTLTLASVQRLMRLAGLRHLYENWCDDASRAWDEEMISAQLIEDWGIWYRGQYDLIEGGIGNSSTSINASVSMHDNARDINHAERNQTATSYTFDNLAERLAQEFSAFTNRTRQLMADGRFYRNPGVILKSVRERSPLSSRQKPDSFARCLELCDLAIRVGENYNSYWLAWYLRGVLQLAVASYDVTKQTQKAQAMPGLQSSLQDLHQAVVQLRERLIPRIFGNLNLVVAHGMNLTSDYVKHELGRAEVYRHIAGMIEGEAQMLMDALQNRNEMVRLGGLVMASELLGRADLAELYRQFTNATQASSVRNNRTQTNRAPIYNTSIHNTAIHNTSINSAAANSMPIDSVQNNDARLHDLRINDEQINDKQISDERIKNAQTSGASTNSTLTNGTSASGTPINSTQTLSAQTLAFDSFGMMLEELDSYGAMLFNLERYQLKPHSLWQYIASGLLSLGIGILGSAISALSGNLFSGLMGINLLSSGLSGMIRTAVAWHKQLPMQFSEFASSCFVETVISTALAGVMTFADAAGLVRLRGSVRLGKDFGGSWVNAIKKVGEQMAISTMINTLFYQAIKHPSLSRDVYAEAQRRAQQVIDRQRDRLARIFLTDEYAVNTHLEDRVYARFREHIANYRVGIDRRTSELMSIAGRLTMGSSAASAVSYATQVSKLVVSSMDSEKMLDQLERQLEQEIVTAGQQSWPHPQLFQQYLAQTLNGGSEIMPMNGTLPVPSLLDEWQCSHFTGIAREANQTIPLNLTDSCQQYRAMMMAHPKIASFQQTMRDEMGSARHEARKQTMHDGANLAQSVYADLLSFSSARQESGRLQQEYERLQQGPAKSEWLAGPDGLPDLEKLLERNDFFNSKDQLKQKFAQEQSGRNSLTGDLVDSLSDDLPANFMQATSKAPALNVAPETANQDVAAFNRLMAQNPRIFDLPRKTPHITQEGETLRLVAAQYQLATEQLAKLNPELTDMDQVLPARSKIQLPLTARKTRMARAASKVPALLASLQPSSSKKASSRGLLGAMYQQVARGDQSKRWTKWLNQPENPLFAEHNQLKLQPSRGLQNHASAWLADYDESVLGAMPERLLRRDMPRIAKLNFIMPSITDLDLGAPSFAGLDAIMPSATKTRAAALSSTASDGITSLCVFRLADAFATTQHLSSWFGGEHDDYWQQISNVASAAAKDRGSKLEALAKQINKIDPDDASIKRDIFVDAEVKARAMLSPHAYQLINKKADDRLRLALQYNARQDDILKLLTDRINYCNQLVQSESSATVRRELMVYANILGRWGQWEVAHSGFVLRGPSLALQLTGMCQVKVASEQALIEKIGEKRYVVGVCPIRGLEKFGHLSAVQHANIFWVKDGRLHNCGFQFVGDDQAGRWFAVGPYKNLSVKRFKFSQSFKIKDLSIVQPGGLFDQYSKRERYNFITNNCHDFAIKMINCLNADPRCVVYQKERKTLMRSIYGYLRESKKRWMGEINVDIVQHLAR